METKENDSERCELTAYNYKASILQGKTGKGKITKPLAFIVI